MSRRTRSACSAGLLLSLLSPNNGLQYWDYQLRVTKKTSDRDRLGVFVFGAFDQLTDKKADKTLFGAQFHRADMRWDRSLPGGAMRVAGTLSFDQSSTGDSGSGAGGDFAVRMFGAGLRIEYEQRAHRDVRVRAGADFGVERFSLLLPGGADTTAAFPTRSDTTGGARVDLVVRASPTVEFVPGVRFDVYSSGGVVVPAIEPRLAARIGIARRVTWLSTLGVAQQPPSFVVPIPGLKIGGLSGGLQKAFQFAEGVEVDLREKTTAKVVAFYHGYLQMNDVISTCLDGEKRHGGDCEINDRARGKTIGLEVFVKRALTERFGGWVSYTLSRTDRTFDGDTFVSQFDRTHVLALVGSYLLGAGWRAGGRFSYVTGRPAYQKFTFFSESVAGVSGFAETRLERLPSFYRLDLRVEKRWNLDAQRWVTFTIEWFNATVNKEATSWTNCRSSSMTCDVMEVGPITIPSLGFEGGF